MKLTNTHLISRKAGVTLLELTVVILVLLTLISILFVGVNAWRRGSDRAANCLNVRNTQQAMRGYQNTTLSAPGASFVSNAVNPGLNDYMVTPVAPANLGGVYAFSAVITGYVGGVAPAPVIAVPANLYITGPATAIPANLAAVSSTYAFGGADVVGW
jgi:type II secretory pathway pseudopilin PulG